MKSDNTPQIEFSLVGQDNGFDHTKNDKYTEVSFSSGTGAARFHIPASKQSGLEKVNSKVLFTRDSKISVDITYRCEEEKYIEGIKSTSIGISGITSISGGGTAKRYVKFKEYAITILNISRNPKSFYVQIDYMNGNTIENQVHKRTFLANSGQSVIINVPFRSNAYIKKIASINEDGTTDEYINLCHDLEKMLPVWRETLRLILFFCFLFLMIFIFSTR